MKERINFSAELTFALVCAGFGLAAAATLAPKTSFFLGNFLYYWLPQAVALFLLSFIKPQRPAALAGFALALAAYLLLFHGWVFSRQRPDSMAWLGYLFSFPGAVIGGFIALALLARRQTQRAMTICLVCAIGMLVGIAVNQTVICSTVMYCGGR